jgi:hypothetical protein
MVGLVPLGTTLQESDRCSGRWVGRMNNDNQFDSNFWKLLEKERLGERKGDAARRKGDSKKRGRSSIWE